MNIILKLKRMQDHFYVNSSSAVLSFLARWEEARVRLCWGISGEQLHGSGVGQVQRLVPGVQQEGMAQERFTDHAEATGSSLHEAPTQGLGGPAGAVSLHGRN